MAKDPAVLWYWNDWNGGTATFTRHLKGCYMDLLSAQFNSGPLSLEEIKTVLGSDFSAWGTIRKKFVTDKDGLFFNERMEAEKEKRAAYKKRQSDFGKKGAFERWKDRVPNGDPNSYPNGDPNGILKNENEVCNEPVFKGGAGGKWKTTPIYPDDCFDLTEMEQNATIEFIYRLKRELLNQQRVNEFWSAFQIQSFTGEKYYQYRIDATTHFRNWLKTQVNEPDKRNTQPNPGAKSGTSAARVEALKNWGRNKTT